MELINTQYIDGFGLFRYFSNKTVKVIYEDRCITSLEENCFSFLLPNGEIVQRVVGDEYDYIKYSLNYSRYAKPLLEYKQWIEMGKDLQIQQKTINVSTDYSIKNTINDIDLFIMENKK